jgi:histidinol-phosphatase
VNPRHADRVQRTLLGSVARSLDEDLRIALELADAGDAVSTLAFGRVDGERKPDGSAVTAVDREIETLLRSRLVELAPTGAVAGEEFGSTASAGRRRWILDPLDGTE